MTFFAIVDSLGNKYSSLPWTMQLATTQAPISYAHNGLIRHMQNH